MKRWLVDVRLTGLNLERCLRRCAETGVELTDMQRSGKQVTARVREDRLDDLCSLAAAGGWQIAVGRRHGLGRLAEAISRRWPLCAAAMLCLALAMSSTGMMWRVEIRGAGAYLGDIRTALQDMGVAAPMRRREVDPAQIRDALEYRYPRIAWIECGWRGSVLLVTVHEGVSAGDTVSTAGRCDIVAARDGVVERITTLAGTPAVKVGQTVRKGQLLIRGEERGADEAVKPVAARGIVLARVWDAASARLAATELQTVYTGREAGRTVVSLPWFDLTTQEEMPFRQQDVSVSVMPLGGLFLPLTIRRERIMEAEISVQPRAKAQLQAEAAVLALQKLRETIGLEDKLIDKWIEYSTIEDGVLQAVAYGERVLDIGVRSDKP